MLDSNLLSADRGQEKFKIRSLECTYASLLIFGRVQVVTSISAATSTIEYNMKYNYLPTTYPLQ